MPIVMKSKSMHHFKRLEDRMKCLKKVLLGAEPNPSLWNYYSLSESDYKRDFTEVEQSDLSVALNDVETAIKELKKVKALKADKLHNSR